LLGAATVKVAVAPDTLAPPGAVLSAPAAMVLV